MGAAGGRSPGGRLLAGVALGLSGIALLVVSGGELGPSSLDAVGTLVALGAAVSWAMGSMLSRQLPVPGSALQLTAMQMLAGGVALLGAGAAFGEWGAVDPAAVTGSSLMALAYLIVFGSWVGFGAYIWLLRHTAPAVATSYAFVNPGVAVLLGWAVAGERLGGSALLAMAVTIAGVILVTAPARAGRRAGASLPGPGDTAPAPARRALRGGRLRFPVG